MIVSLALVAQFGDSFSRPLGLPCRLWFGACERPAFRRAWPPLFCWPADFEFSEELARVAAVIRESGTQRPARGRIACPGGWRMECHKFYHCADPHERLRDI